MAHVAAHCNTLAFFACGTPKLHRYRLLNHTKIRDAFTLVVKIFDVGMATWSDDASHRPALRTCVHPYPLRAAETWSRSRRNAASPNLPTGNTESCAEARRLFVHASIGKDDASAKIPTKSSDFSHIPASAGGVLNT
jgi:hypothetical protein